MVVKQLYPSKPNRALGKWLGTGERNKGHQALPFNHRSDMVDALLGDLGVPRAVLKAYHDAVKRAAAPPKHSWLVVRVPFPRAPWVVSPHSFVA